MAVAFDLQAVQSRDHGERGVARYVREQALALERRHAESVAFFALNPDLSVPTDLEILGDRVVFSDDADLSAVTAWHVPSPFELGISLDRLWPQRVRKAGARLVVTLYDIIPALFPEHYLRDPGTARRYHARMEFVRRADAVLALSEATARDAVRLVGIQPSRITVIGAGRSGRFRPAGSVDGARAEAVRRFPALREGFVLYLGGVDYRKNVSGLLAAYSRLPAALRRQHMLAIACSVPPAYLEQYGAEMRDLGIADDVVFIGRVSDEDLVVLYQATELFAFPSLYEGFGLPVIEARACGAPVIASRTSSIAEVLSPDEACFDPRDPADIASALERVLSDPAELERLRHMAFEDHTWENVADATAEVYDRLDKRGRRRRPQHRRIAYVSPIPPCSSGVAGYSTKLLGELRQHADIDVFYDGPGEPDALPPGVNGYPIDKFLQVEAVRNGFDQIIYCIANQTFHASALELLRRRPGAVIAHDLRLTGLYAWCADNRPDLVPNDFATTLQRMYDHRFPEWLGTNGFLDYREADQYGVFMARDVIANSTRFLVHSSTASRWAHIDARAQDRHKIDVLPFGIPSRDRATGSEHSSGPLVASFGVVDSIKRSPTVLEAFAHIARARPDARLALVGPLPEESRALYLARARELGVEDAVTVTGRVTDDEYERWLRAADVAMQLRASAGGEWSAAVADCLSVGVPALVSHSGFARDITEGAVVPVPVEMQPEELGAAAVDLLADADRRRRIGDAALEFAAAHTFCHAAASLYALAIAP